MHSIPCRAGPGAHDFARSEIEIMLSMNVIEPAQTEWASLAVFARRKRNFEILCWLQKTQRRPYSCLVCILKDGWLDSLTPRASTIFYSRRDWRLQADWSTLRGPWENSIHFPPWLIPIYSDAVRFIAWFRHLSVCHEFYFFPREVAVFPSICWRFNHLLAYTASTHGPYTTCFKCS